MRKLLFLAVVSLVVFLVPAAAQDTKCFHTETYVGFAATMNGKEFSRNDVRNGFNASFGVFASERVLLQANLAANRGPGEQISLTLGPKFNFRPKATVNPFVNAGAGLQRSAFPTSIGEARDSQFIWHAGGGLEINKGRWSFRVAQVEYVSAKQPDGTQNRLRAGAGIAFRL